MGLVLLGRFSSLPEAHVVCSCLRAEGLNPVLLEGQFAWNMWTMRQYLGGIAVWAPEPEVEHAVAVLQPRRPVEPFGARPRVRDDLVPFTLYAVFACLSHPLAWGAAVLKSPTARGWRHAAGWVMTASAAIMALYFAVKLVIGMAALGFGSSVDGY